MVQRTQQLKDGAWLDSLGGELAAQGLRVKGVSADGNCFFRALSDQLVGHPMPPFSSEVDPNDFEAVSRSLLL